VRLDVFVGACPASDQPQIKPKTYRLQAGSYKVGAVWCFVGACPASDQPQIKAKTYRLQAGSHKVGAA
jgi:uncharacterized protein (DUF736 family)